MWPTITCNIQLCKSHAAPAPCLCQHKVLCEVELNRPAVLCCTGSVSAGSGTGLPCAPEGGLPTLSSLTKATPSPLLQWQLLDILYSYVFVMRLYNGEYSIDAQVRTFPDCFDEVSQWPCGSFAELQSYCVLAQQSATLHMLSAASDRNITVQ